MIRTACHDCAPAPAGARRCCGAAAAEHARDPCCRLSARLSRAREVFDEIDLFVAPSAALAGEYVRLGWDERRIEVSDYGFTQPPQVPRDRKRAHVTIGFVGTMAWHKGAHVLIEAVRRLRGAFEVVIAGDPERRPGIPRPAEARRRRPARAVRGRVRPRERCREIYGGLDVLVVPSLWPENSPLVIHEAFMHGVAVVGARMGGIPELVEDGVNGFTYEAFSPDALAAVLQRFLDDPGLADAARVARRPR